MNRGRNDAGRLQRALAEASPGDNIATVTARQPHDLIERLTTAGSGRRADLLVFADTVRRPPRLPSGDPV